MSFHGFRAMASTLLNELGYNRDWIERQLAHGPRDAVRASFNYAEYLPEREPQNEGYPQISIADTGWTGEEREAMSEHGFDDMDMLRA